MLTYAQIRERARQASVETERSYLASALDAHGWSVRATAASLNTSESALRRALERHPELAESARHRTPGPGRPRHTAG